MTHMKKIQTLTAYILIAIILLSTIVSLLGVWDVIDLNDVGTKILSSLLIIFAASVVALFIFNVMINRDNKDQLKNG